MTAAPETFWNKNMKKVMILLDQPLSFDYAIPSRAISVITEAYANLQSVPHVLDRELLERAGQVRPDARPPLAHLELLLQFRLGHADFFLDVSVVPRDLAQVLEVGEGLVVPALAEQPCRGLFDKDGADTEEADYTVSQGRGDVGGLGVEKPGEEERRGGRRKGHTRNELNGHGDAERHGGGLVEGLIDAVVDLCISLHSRRGLASRGIPRSQPMRPSDR